MPDLETCLHGHPWTYANTRVVATKSGHLQRQCKACATERTRIFLRKKYRHDAEWRERMKALSRQRYYARKHQEATQ